MSRVFWSTSLAILLLSGCVDPQPASTDTGASPSVLIDEDRPEPTFGVIPEAERGTVAPPDLNATLEAAPKLVPGEWWRIKFHDDFLDRDVEFIRVVAKAEAEGYVVGMPHEAWYKESVIFHTPAFGDVKPDLSYHAHDVPFVPLKFPLSDGATWETHWEFADQPLTALVKAEDAYTANISFTGRACGLLVLVGACAPNAGESVVIQLVYDARTHEVVHFETPGFWYDVVEHGYGFQGWITVPRGEDLVFLHGRVGASVVNFPAAGAVGPSDAVTVEGGFNRVSFILVAGNFLANPPTGGAYRITATAPNGTVFERESIPGEPWTFEFYEAADPDGAWQLDYLVAGAGYAFIEGIAYHQYDIRLPDGLARSDHSHAVVR